MSLLAGIDRATGKLIGNVRRPRHRSIEFVALLRVLDAQSPSDVKIRSWTTTRPTRKRAHT